MIQRSVTFSVCVSRETSEMPLAAQEIAPKCLAFLALQLDSNIWV